MIPVVYSDSNQAIVDGYNGRPPAAGDDVYWNDVAANPVRQQIKDHYIEQQQRRCCYCNRVYATNNHAMWDGEHIIPKSLAPKFLFEPRNLAASCKDCNIAKKESEVRVTPTRLSFPDRSSHYRIVHPHFDNYTDHIRWIGDAVQSFTPKGSRLISMCNLTRFGHLKVGANPAPPNPLYDDMLGKLMDPKRPIAELRMALAAIKEHIESTPQDD